MNSPRPMKVRVLSAKRLILYVKRNPGLTATQYGRLLNKPFGTISSALYILVRSCKLSRYEGQGATQDKQKSWRYYTL